jgi:hypothetical protein
VNHPEQGCLVLPLQAVACTGRKGGQHWEKSAWGRYICSASVALPSKVWLS